MHVLLHTGLNAMTPTAEHSGHLREHAKLIWRHLAPVVPRRHDLCRLVSLRFYLADPPSTSDVAC